MQVQGKKAAQEEHVMQLVLTDEQIEAIAEKAADKAVGKLTDTFYKQVGKSFVDKTLIIIGVIGTGVYFTGKNKGWWQ